MSKPSILSVVCLVLAVCALAANHSVGRIETGTLRKLPVGQFPKRVGVWTMVVEHPTDPEVQKTIPTAVIVDRVYQNQNGEQVNLTLLTATDYSDFHDPNICFPGQGFTLTEARVTTICAQEGRLMTAEREGLRQRVFYWWSGRAAVDTTYGRDQMGKLLALRDKFISAQGHSLFVRIIVPDGDKGVAMMKDFLTSAQKPLAQLPLGAVAENDKDLTTK